MPRKPRCRRIGGYPDCWVFSPEERSQSDPVVLTLDEFETVRLLDREGLTQEECAARMDVARTTVTAIYENARRKIAEALVDGRELRIRGGSYALENQITDQIPEKGKNTMRIAVTYENGEIFQHFGHTEQFKLYDVSDGKIVGEQIVPTNGSGHGALAEAGIALYGGVTGSADAAAKALAEGVLRFDPDAKCDHHGHGHEHGEDHACGHQGGVCGHGHCADHHREGN